MSDLVWTETLDIRTDDLTPEGFVSLPALNVYLQEAAGSHAASLGVSTDALAEEGRAWVLGQLRTSIDRRPARNDSVTVETWPSGLDGLFATREFVVHVGADPVAWATSSWFLIDVERRRPVRPPEVVRTLDPPDRDPVLPASGEELSEPTAVDHEHTLTVGYHDLDRNEHVNNVRYLTWALDSLPASVYEHYRCVGTALDFQNEVAVGASIRVTVGLEENGDELRGRHSLRNVETGQTVAVVRTTWRSDGG